MPLTDDEIYQRLLASIKKTKTGSIRPAFSWNPQLTTEFTKLAAEEFGPPQKDYGIYTRLAERFTNLTGHCLTTKQARKKHNSQRKEFLKWEKLKNKTGAGWDNVWNTVTGDSDWWKDQAREFGQGILKYRIAPIPDLEYLEQIFKSVTTGTNAITSTQVCDAKSVATGTNVVISTQVGDQERNVYSSLPNTESNHTLSTKKSNWDQEPLLQDWNLNDVPPLHTNEIEVANENDPLIIVTDASSPSHRLCLRPATGFSAACQDRKRAHNTFIDDVRTTVGYMSKKTQFRSSSSERSESSAPSERPDPILDDAKTIMDRCMSLGGSYEQWELTSLVMKIDFRKGVKILTDDDQARKWVESEVQALRKRR